MATDLTTPSKVNWCIDLQLLESPTKQTGFVLLLWFHEGGGGGSFKGAPMLKESIAPLPSVPRACG